MASVFVLSSYNAIVAGLVNRRRSVYQISIAFCAVLAKTAAHL